MNQSNADLRTLLLHILQTGSRAQLLVYFELHHFETEKLKLKQRFDRSLVFLGLYEFLDPIMSTFFNISTAIVYFMNEMIQLTGFQAGFLLLKVFWSHDLQQRVEKRHVGQLTDQNQRLEQKYKQRKGGRNLVFKEIKCHSKIF